MGYLSDSLDFEKFFAKDTWDRLKKDPKRLVLGVDPASTWAWNKILGRDDEPLVDQMGGPYDGRVFSFGHGEGGVYDRAQAAGINTQSAQTNHDLAHLIAGSYAAGGLGLGGNGGGGSGGDLFARQAGNTTNFSTGMSTGANPAAGISGIAGPVSGPAGGGASAGAGLGAMDYAKLGMNAAGQMQQPQQQQPMAAPPPRQATPFQPQTMGQRMNAGLGRVSNALFPVNPQLTAGMDPAYAQQLQNNAMLQLGLGMASAGRKPGATFGSALGAGLGQAQGDLMGAMQTAYQNARQARADTRAESRDDREMQREDRLDARQQWLEDHTLNREKTADQRYKEEQEFRLKQAEQAQKRWEAEQAAQAQWRKDQIAERSAGTVPTGYRIKQDGTGLEPIPGGPADPAVGKGKITDAERLTAAYAQRMKSAAQTIDTLNYTPTPTELSAFNYMAGEPGFKQSAANAVLSPEARQYFQALQDFSRAKLRKESGAVISKEEIAGDLATFFPLPLDDDKTKAQKKAARETALQGMITAAGPAYQQQPATPSAQPPRAMKAIGGKNYVQINGQWYEDDGTSTGQ